jgi:hypothetical protein
MKHILTGFSLISACALLALALGCASSTPTQSEQDMLIAAGFKTITPRDAAQQQKLQALPPRAVGPDYEKRPDLLRLSRRGE